jgi:hypothetical protein
VDDDYGFADRGVQQGTDPAWLALVADIEA